MEQPAQNDAKASERVYTACIIVIGNEILSGRTQDSNIAFLAKALNEAGVRLREARVIPDVTETIVATVNEVRAKFDYVFTTGGIGPTHDDITAASVAEAFGVKLRLDEQARDAMQARYGDTPMNEARLRMAYVPETASLIENPISAAPGFRIENVFVLAGVPAIARAMFRSLRPNLVGGAEVLSRTVNCHLPEGTIAAELEAIQTRWPEIEIGSYPMWTNEGPATSLVLRGTDAIGLDAATAAVVAMIEAFGGVPEVPLAGSTPG
jgi:molybdenum cofactor synthesis domain-containing protein